MRTNRYVVSVPGRHQGRRRIRLRGKGEAGSPGGQPGDLYVRSTSTPSPVFTRRGDDLVVDVPVLFAEAAVGRHDRGARRPTARRVKLKVPAGTADGVLLRAKGRGAPKNGDSGKRGDLLARVHISVPRSSAAPRSEALENYAKLDGENPRADLFAARRSL